MRILHLFGRLLLLFYTWQVVQSTFGACTRSARNLSTQFTTPADCARMCSRLAVASLAALMLASIARAQVTLNVIPRAANRYCHPNGFKLSHTLNPEGGMSRCLQGRLLRRSLERLQSCKHCAGSLGRWADLWRAGTGRGVQLPHGGDVGGAASRRRAGK